jgi:hypothetical protein
MPTGRAQPTNPLGVVIGPDNNGVTSTSVSPEELRRTGLKHLSESGADPYTVADIAGQEGIAWTEPYGPPSHIPRTPIALHGETPFHRW